jgi:peptide deformylase
MAKIVTVPNPVLREKSKEVAFDKKTSELVETLKNTLVDDQGKLVGAGLSAVQIGIPKRVFVVYSNNSKRILTFINPQITWYSKRLTDGLPGKHKYEGCLSLPNKWSIIKRSKDIKVSYLAENGQPQTRKFSGVVATIIQHEYDHLDGVLFIDRALQQGSKIYEFREDKDGQEYFEEINID